MNQDDMVPLSDLRPGDRFLFRCCLLEIVQPPFSGPGWYRTIRWPEHEVQTIGFGPGYRIKREDITFAESRGKPE